MCLQFRTLCEVMSTALKSIPLQLRTLGEAVFLTEMSDALLCLEDLCLCHALQSLLPVLMHMDLELVEEISWLDVRAILVEYVAVLDVWLLQGGVLMCFVRRNPKLSN